MRRRLGLRIGVLALVVITTTPTFAAPRDDSPFGSIGRAIDRVINQIKRVIHIQDGGAITLPKP